MNPAQIKTKKFIICPGCNIGESSIQHLLDDSKRTHFDGEWYCDRCGCSYKFTIDGGKVFAEVNPAKWKKPALTLLKLVPKNTVYAVVEDAIYDYAPDGGNKRYYYEEHTCPTNVLPNIEYLLDGDNTDPHGIWQFCAIVENPTGELDSNLTAEDLAELFHFDELRHPKLLN